MTWATTTRKLSPLIILCHNWDFPASPGFSSHRGFLNHWLLQHLPCPRGHGTHCERQLLLQLLTCYLFLRLLPPSGGNPTRLWLSNAFLYLCTLLPSCIYKPHWGWPCSNQAQISCEPNHYLIMLVEVEEKSKTTYIWTIIVPDFTSTCEK